MITWLPALILMVTMQFASAHKPEHMKLHEMFYQTWMQPDNRNVSCCSNEDCEPAQAYEKDGFWYARKISEIETYPEYVRIPPKKVEYDRDSPDGQSHICGRRYAVSNMEMTVYCFKAGAGG